MASLTGDQVPRNLNGQTGGLEADIHHFELMFDSLGSMSATGANNDKRSTIKGRIK